MDPDMNNTISNMPARRIRACRRQSGSRSIRDAWDALLFGRARRDASCAARVASGINRTKVINSLIVFSARLTPRRRPPAPVRLRAAQGAHAAPLRHADRQPAHLLSVACLRFRLQCAPVAQDRAPLQRDDEAHRRRPGGRELRRRSADTDRRPAIRIISSRRSPTRSRRPTARR